jgi:hypothetical protein
VKFLVIVAIIGQFILSVELWYAAKDLQDFRHNVIYDVSNLRRKYVMDLSEFYVSGCKEGTKWEAGPPVLGFNPNNELSYCTNKFEGRKELVDFLVDQIGQ